MPCGAMSSVGSRPSANSTATFGRSASWLYPSISGFIGGPGLPDAPNCAKSTAVLRRGGAMDDHGQLEYATASGNDYAGHEQMYHTFVTLTRSAVAVIAVILILMAIFLT